MGDIIMKIWFLILAAVALAACESDQQARQREMMEARRMVAAQFGNTLSPTQQAYLTMQLFQRMEADRYEDARVTAEFLTNGLNNSAAIMQATSQAQYQRAMQPVPTSGYPSTRGTALDPIYIKPVQY